LTPSQIINDRIELDTSRQFKIKLKTRFVALRKQKTLKAFRDAAIYSVS